MSNENKNRFLKNAGGILVQNFASQGSTFIVNLFIARQLGPANFGIYSLSILTLNSAIMASSLSAPAIGAQFIGQSYAENSEISIFGWRHCKKVGLISSLIVSTLFILCSFIPNLKIGNEFPYQIVLPIITLGIISSLYISHVSQGIAAIEQIRVLTIFTTFSSLLYMVSGILGAFLFGVFGGLIGVILSMLISAVIAIFLENIFFKSISLKKEKIDIKKITKGLNEKILPMSTAGFLLLGSNWLLSALVMFYCSKTEMGIFSSANQMRILVMLLPQIMNSAGMVIRNRTHKSVEKTNYRALSIKYMLFFSLACTIIGACFSFLIPILFGEKYKSSVSIFYIFLPSILLESFILLIRQELQTHDKFREWLIWVMCPWQFSCAIAALILIPIYGAIGASASYSVGLIGGILGYLILSRKSNTGKNYIK